MPSPGDRYDEPGSVPVDDDGGQRVEARHGVVPARRLPGCSERIPRRRAVPVGNGVRVTFHVPARKRVKHVWAYWGWVSGQLKPALAAQHRLGKSKDGPSWIQARVRAAAGRDYLGGDPFGVPG